MAENKTTGELSESANPTLGELVNYNNITKITERSSVKKAVGGKEAVGIDWQPAPHSYTDEGNSGGDTLNYIAKFGGLYYESIINGNVGIIPGTGIGWNLLIISDSDGLIAAPHEVGLFTIASSRVQVNNSTYTLLADVPFNSTDFAAELIANDWGIGSVGALPELDFTGVDNGHQNRRIIWDDANNCPAYYNDRTGVKHQIGREFWERGNNNTGVQINNGSIIYIEDYNSIKEMPNMDLADATNINKSSVIAFATENIIDQDDGEFTRAGRVNDVVTFGYIPGQKIYLSETIPGGFQSGKPLPPNNSVEVGNVAKVSSGVGVPDGSIDARIHDISEPESKVISSSFSSSGGATGVDNYIDSHYIFGGSITPGAGDNLGSPGEMHGSHAFIVLSSASTDMVIRVSGDSWDEQTETIGDFSDIDTSGGAANAYFETPEKWNGQVSFTLQSGTPVDVNIGFSFYFDNGNSRFILTQVVWSGVAGANDASPDFQVIKHSDQGWTYAVPGPIPPTPSVDLQSILTNGGLINGSPFAFKINGFSDVVEGDIDGGIVLIVNYNSNNSILTSNINLEILN